MREILVLVLLGVACTTTAITGTVVDEFGTPIHNASITVTSRENIDGGSAFSDEAGQFTMSFFGSRNEIVVRAAGYSEVRMEPPTATSFRIVLKRAQTRHGSAVIFLEGIGASLEDSGSAIVLKEVHPCGPAFEAQLVKGMEVLEVNGKPVHTENTSGAARAIRGAAGTQVELRLRDPGSRQERRVVLSRTMLEVPCPEVVDAGL